MFITDREQALRNALQLHFPNSVLNVCIWHVDKNIVANCRRAFAPDGEEWKLFMEEWHRLAYCPDESAYDENWARLMKLLKERSQVVEYLQKNILPHRQLFMTAWAGKLAHLGNISSSRAESGHSFIKKYILTNRMNMAKVFLTLSGEVDRQLEQIVSRQSHEMTKWLSHVPSALRPLHGKISCYASSLAKEQYQKLKQMDKEGGDQENPCSGTFTTSMGIPCAHRMKDILEQKGQLEPDDFHLQWHLRYNPEADVSTIPLFPG